MESHYDAKNVEGKIYAFWEKGRYFEPKEHKHYNKKKYSIALPPPNITGRLHMGHALNGVEQDILIRYHRMKGFKTLWLPGIDHAGIATQNVVEKQLRKQDLNRHILGREKFLERVWEWKEEYGEIILNQYKQLGASCDWSRRRFTFDKEYEEAVQEAFMKYYKKGLVYRGKRVVNWCVKCQTSISDLEVEKEVEKGKLWYIKYPIIGTTEFVTVATTRPETMLGDTGVAVHPSDKRYKKLVGKKIALPLTNREIPIVADNEVDQEFGTGAVKVTPAHDFTDQKIGQKCKLESIEIIDTLGKLNRNVPPQYQGLKVLQAREKVVEDLKQLDLLVKIENHEHAVPRCERCNGLIEPLQSEQWFVKMKPLVKPAMEAIKKEKVIFHPASYKKLQLNWMKGIHDWCISRQLWWGHRMPVWECQEKHEFFASITKPKKCEICSKCKPKQVDDVFDTWFSSALWPFATLGWPNKTADLKNFYPTNAIITARDIMNLWISRMTFSGIEFTNKLPFKDVLVHATILTKDGKRMSKSKGTGIDPIELIEKYGADATRMGLAWQVTDLQDIRFGEDNLIAGKKFCNKVWNATRFVLSNIEDESLDISKEPKPKTEADKKILDGLKETIVSSSKDIEEFKFGSYIRNLYDFFWHEFCDVYIEESKKQNDGNTQLILIYTLEKLITLMHPCMPFITEELYSLLPIKNKSEALIIHPWPKTAKKAIKKPKNTTKKHVKK